MNPLSSDEQKRIAKLSSMQRSVFCGYLLNNHTSGQDPRDGWTQMEIEEALFAGPNAWRDALYEAERQRGY
jgi:hypothetical protein